MTDQQIVTDDRYPGWPVRIVVDTDVGQPGGDAIAPAPLVERGYGEWAGEVYQSEHDARILEAWRRLDRAVFERYLRQAHGTTAVEEITERNLTVIAFNTTGYRTQVVFTGPADLSGETRDWRAWLDGDVYKVVVERHTEDRCWTYQDALCGLYGWSYAHHRAAYLVTENAAARMPVA